MATGVLLAGRAGPAPAPSCGRSPARPGCWPWRRGPARAALRDLDPERDDARRWRRRPPWSRRSRCGPPCSPRRPGDGMPGRPGLGIGLALAGVVLLTGVDFALSSRALVGDLLALVGGVLAAAYVTVGGGGAPAREHDGVHHASATARLPLLLLVLCLRRRGSCGGYARKTWLAARASPSGRSCWGTRCSTGCCRRPARPSCRSRSCSRSRGGAAGGGLPRTSASAGRAPGGAALLVAGVSSSIRRASASRRPSSGRAALPYRRSDRADHASPACLDTPRPRRSCLAVPGSDPEDARQGPGPARRPGVPRPRGRGRAAGQGGAREPTSSLRSTTATGPARRGWCGSTTSTTKWTYRDVIRSSRAPAQPRLHHAAEGADAPSRCSGSTCC